jgi:hypothetical protein
MPTFLILSLIIFRHLRVSWCGVPSLARGRVCSRWASPVQHFSCLSQTGVMGIFHCLYVRDPPTWRARFLYLFSPRNREAQIFSVRVFLWPTVSQYVLMLSPPWGRLTRYCFLFKSLRLEFVVLSLWGALSDQRAGLSCKSQSSNLSACTFTIYTFVLHIFITNIYNTSEVWTSASLL